MTEDEMNDFAEAFLAGQSFKLMRVWTDENGIEHAFEDRSGIRIHYVDETGKVLKTEGGEEFQIL